MGNYGAAGYALGTWTQSFDRVAMPGATLAMEQGQRWWGGTSPDVRALQSPERTERRIGAWYDLNELRLRLSFSQPYTGNLHLYAMDWLSNVRRQDVIVDDGTGARRSQITTAFDQGAWLHFPVAVPAGGSVSITVVRTGEHNAILSGLFLDEAAPVAAPNVSPNSANRMIMWTGAPSWSSSATNSWTCGRAEARVGSPATSVT